MLVRMVLDGRCTLDDLDWPSPGWDISHRDATRIYTKWNLTPRPYKNLARQWISANPAEWDQLQKTHGAANG